LKVQEIHLVTKGKEGGVSGRTKTRSLYCARHRNLDAGQGIRMKKWEYVRGKGNGEVKKEENRPESGGRIGKLSYAGYSTGEVGGGSGMHKNSTDTLPK